MGGFHAPAEGQWRPDRANLETHGLPLVVAIFIHYHPKVTLDPAGSLYQFYRRQLFKVTSSNASGGLSFMLTKLGLEMTLITCERTDGCMVLWSGVNAE